MERVFSGERTWLAPVLRPFEAAIHRLAGISPGAGQHWTRYATACLVFNLSGWLLLYAILRLQHMLPWNPPALPALSPHLAFNTAVRSDDRRAGQEGVSTGRSQCD